MKIDEPEPWLAAFQQRWLGPRTAMTKTAYTILYVVNWILIRLLFRVSVDGPEHLPVVGPCIVTPNHASPLDPPVLAAVMPLAMLQQTYWAGKHTSVLRNRLRRCLSWLTRVIPISGDRTSLAPAVTILERGDILVWFPEGKRSLSGKLQEFKPGIAMLLAQCDVPVVPVLIEGAYRAIPTRGSWPRLRTRIVVRIGLPLSAQQLGLTSISPEVINRTAATLRQCVADLGSNP